MLTPLHTRVDEIKLPAPPSSWLSRATYAIIVVAHIIPRKKPTRMNCPVAFILPNSKIQKLMRKKWAFLKNWLNDDDDSDYSVSGLDGTDLTAAIIC